VVSRLRRLPAFGPAVLLTLSAACTQVLGIQEARIDETLTGGSSSTAAGKNSVPDAGAPSSGGSSGGSVGAGGHHAGGSSNSADGGVPNDNPGMDGGMSNAGTGDVPQQAGTCETYCDAVINNCKGKYEQYRSFEQCIEVCKRLPEGAVGDENVNTVQCRIRQARFAESEAFLYCKSAGPLGAGKCGSNCISFCSLMDVTCTATTTAGNTEASYFTNNSACLASCGALPEDPTGPVQYSSSATATPSTLMGNNVYCRMYHVAAALEQDAPTEHCPHAMGGDPCIAQ
jgi:hypothetical protein